MIPSERCVSFIKDFEGYSEHAYQDTGGVWTIGYGTIKYPNNIDVKQGDTCNEQEALEYLHFEINEKSKSVTNLIKETPINQNQFDALTSFAYNVGSNALAGSTLLHKLKINPHDSTIYQYEVDAENKPVIDSCEFVRWCRDNKKVINGLLRRRAREADMYAGK